MLLVFAGFTGPAIAIPIVVLTAAFLALVTWLMCYIVYNLRKQPLPNKLLLKLMIAFTILLAVVGVIVDKTKRW